MVDDKKKAKTKATAKAPVQPDSVGSEMLQVLHNVDTVAISFSAELHLICIVIAELERKIQEGGLKATGCVNSLGPRRSLSIHLGILCHLQAACMQAAEPRLWKTGWASLQRSSREKKRKSERERRWWWWRRRCLAWGRRLRSQQTKLARPLAAELLRRSDFFFSFSF